MPNRVADCSATLPVSWAYFVEEILVILGVKVGFCTGLAAERLTITHLLQVVQAAGDTLVAGTVEGVEVDAGTTYTPE